MTKDEFADITGIDEEAVVLEDWDIFSKAIIGVDQDGMRVVYGYDRIIKALAESYMKDDGNLSQEEATTMAVDWVDYNTLRGLPYIAEEHRPIIVFELAE